MQKGLKKKRLKRAERKPARDLHILQDVNIKFEAEIALEEKLRSAQKEKQDFIKNNQILQEDLGALNMKLKDGKEPEDEYIRKLEQTRKP